MSAGADTAEPAVSEGSIEDLWDASDLVDPTLGPYGHAHVLDRGADASHVRRRQVLRGVEDDTAPFGEVVEPPLAHIAPSKGVQLPVLGQQCADASTQVELSDGAWHRSWQRVYEMSPDKTTGIRRAG